MIFYVVACWKALSDVVLFGLDKAVQLFDLILKMCWFSCHRIWGSWECSNWFLDKACSVIFGFCCLFLYFQGLWNQGYAQIGSHVVGIVMILGIS